MPPVDPNQNQQRGLTSPAEDLIEITPHDVNDLAKMPRALCCRVSGDAVVITKKGTTGTIFLAAGVPFSLEVTRVKATGTTATGIVGLL